MIWRAVTIFSAASFVVPALAGEVVSSPELRLGECVVFREGGAGFVLKSPTYWMRGRVAAIDRQRRRVERCSPMGGAWSSNSHRDRTGTADDLPCAVVDSETGEVNVVRVQVAVEDWETPWSHQHGAPGWLFRGRFADKPLKKGELIDMDAAWLERCGS